MAIGGYKRAQWKRCVDIWGFNMNEEITLKEILSGLLLMGMFYISIWMLYLVVPESWI